MVFQFNSVLLFIILIFDIIFVVHKDKLHCFLTNIFFIHFVLFFYR